MSVAVKEHLGFIHGETDSFITVATKRNGEIDSHYHYKGVDAAYEAVMKKVIENVDIYSSHAVFSHPKRGKATLFTINTLFADLDAHELGETIDADVVMWWLEQEFFNRKVPTPSEVVMTGRGVQLYWKIENAPKQVLPLWELVELRLLEELQEITDFIPTLEVDMGCKDITRIARIPDTYNVKGETDAYIVYQNDNVYRLHDIIEEYFEDLHISDERREELKAVKVNKTAKVKTKTVKVNKTIIKLFNVYTLSYQRSVDFLMILELRGGDVKGCRDAFFFFYIWTVIDRNSTYEDVYRELDSINSLFKKPMSDTKVKTKAKHVYNKFQSKVLKRENGTQKYHRYDRYVFTNETIIEALNITKDEQKHMTTIISKREKYDRKNKKRNDERRDEKNMTPRERAFLENKLKVKELVTKGYKQKDIVTETGLSKSRVSELCKIIRTEG